MFDPKISCSVLVSVLLEFSRIGERTCVACINHVLDSHRWHKYFMTQHTNDIVNKGEYASCFDIVVFHRHRDYGIPTVGIDRFLYICMDRMRSTCGMFKTMRSSNVKHYISVNSSKRRC